MVLDLMRLRAERVAKGLTQAQLAEKIGMKRAAYAKRENGLVNMGADELAKIVDALGMSKNDMYIFLQITFPKKNETNRKDFEMNLFIQERTRYDEPTTKL